MLKNIIVFLIIVILVVFGWYLWQDYQNPEANPAQVVELANLPELALGNGRYINIFYGFAFDYPEGWYIGYEGGARGNRKCCNYRKSSSEVAAIHPLGTYISSNTSHGTYLIGHEV